MREILFRGKNDDGKWVYGWLDSLHCSNPHTKTISSIYFTEISDDFRCRLNTIVDYKTVGQFTGLTDKNGKIIFEGDIIKIPDDYDEFGVNAGEVYEVYFAFGGFRLKPKRSNAKGFWLEDDKTVEIIGNIHDNPEMMEVDDV